MDDIAKIAAGLSDAEIRMLLAHKTGKIFSGRHWRETPASDPLSWAKSGLRLRQIGLINWVSRIGEDTVLTRLGQQVRTHLENSK